MQLINQPPNPRFTEFIQQPWLKNIANLNRWTISTNEKIPVDMYNLEYRHIINGCDISIPYSTVTLHDLYKKVPNAKNFAFYLCAGIHDIVILDIEPICPSELKAKLMNLPCLYAETSMSGKGIHMIFPYPEDIAMQYPNACKAAMKYKKYYEILMNHCVTFTGNIIPHTPITDKNSLQPFRNVFKELAIKQKESIVVDINIDLEKIKPVNCKVTDNILFYLAKYADEDTHFQHYIQSQMDLGEELDHSTFEFNYMTSLYTKLKSILKISFIDDELQKHGELTIEEQLWFVTSIAKERIKPRKKHDEKRNNMPWLIYLASTAAAKYEQRLQNSAANK